MGKNDNMHYRMHPYTSDSNASYCRKSGMAQTFSLIGRGPVLFWKATSWMKLKPGSELYK